MAQLEIKYVVRKYDALTNKWWYLHVPHLVTQVPSVMNNTFHMATFFDGKLAALAGINKYIQLNGGRGEFVIDEVHKY